MSTTRIIFLTAFAMIAFAGNSVLCRAALTDTNIDAASFTTFRLISGALMLYLLSRINSYTAVSEGSWLSASALFVYAAGFSFAYISLPAATGALLLFGAVQVTMIGYGIFRGERLTWIQVMGVLLALAGLVGLLLPGISTPSLFGSILMVSAGIAWGTYSLRGRGIVEPTTATAGNFLRAVPMSLLLSLIMFQDMTFDIAGLCYAIASGGLASGIGYAIWYTVLPALKSAYAATVQLSVPVIAAFAGIVLLGEPLSMEFVMASVAIISGIALVIMQKQIG